MLPLTRVVSLSATPADNIEVKRKNKTMISLTIYYNEEEGWVHVLTSEVSAEGAHKVWTSSIHNPPAGTSLLNFATFYHTNIGVSQDRVHVFRADRVLLP